MIKYAILAAACILAVAARPQDPEVTITQDVRETNGDGTYNYLSETSDGTRVEQKGYIKNPEAPADEQIQVMEGSFSFRADDGNVYTVTYTADENGFVPQGDHLPTPPPTPDHVLKTIKILEANAAAQRKRAAQYHQA